MKNQLDPNRPLKIFVYFSVFCTVLFLLGGIIACTYSVTLVHTSGQATDVVDETASNTPTTSISPSVKIPPTML